MTKRKLFWQRLFDILLTPLDRYIKLPGSHGRALRRLAIELAQS